MKSVAALMLAADNQYHAKAGFPVASASITAQMSRAIKSIGNILIVKSTARRACLHRKFGPTGKTKAL